MNLKTPMFWVRWGAFLASLVLGIELELELWFGNSRPAVFKVVVGLLLHLLFGVVFVINTKDFPSRGRRHLKLLFVQILLTIPVNMTLAIINCIAIPLICTASARKKWLGGQIVALFISMALTLLTQRTQLAKMLPGHWPELLLAVSSGVAEVGIWCLVAYFAGVLVVRTDEDRRRLIALNAELLSSRSLLAESSRLSERLRVARELHDSLGHHLTTLNLNLEIARHSPTSEKDGHIQKAQFLARLLLGELRDSVSAWRKEGSVALPEALRSLAAGVSGIKINLDIEQELPTMDPGKAHAFLRCAQEALTNVLRHSSATAVNIVLKRRNEVLSLVVNDNGRGCDNLVHGNGLTGISDRANEWQGRASIESKAGQGFTVNVEIPFAGGLP
jgi:signal transduction histidine kinase